MFGREHMENEAARALSAAIGAARWELSQERLADVLRASLAATLAQSSGVEGAPKADHWQTSYASAVPCRRIGEHDLA